MRYIVLSLLIATGLFSCKKSDSAPQEFEGSINVNIDGGLAKLTNVGATKTTIGSTDKYVIAGGSGSEILNIELRVPTGDPLVGVYPAATKLAELIIFKHTSGTDYITFSSSKNLDPDNVWVKVTSFSDGILKGEFSGKPTSNDGVVRVLTMGTFEAKIK